MTGHDTRLACHNAVHRSHHLVPCLVAEHLSEQHIGLNLAIAIDDGRRQHDSGAESQIRGRRHSSKHCEHHCARLCSRFMAEECQLPYASPAPREVDDSSIQVTSFATALSLSSLDRLRPLGSCSRAAGWRCAGHAQQLGGESLLPNLMEVKG